MNRNGKMAKILAPIVIGILMGSPVQTQAEPLTLSALGVKVGMSLLVSGFNFLLGKATQSPDLHFEKTKQIHSELRSLHNDVLKNRALQIQIHTDAALHRNEIENLIINVGEGVKLQVDRSAEMQRVLNVLSSTVHVLDTAEILRNTKGEEHARTSETLREEVSRLDRVSNVLDFGEHLRPVMMLPRIGAIQAKWMALQTMDNMEQNRAHFVRHAGQWLESQRHSTGESDPVKQTLGDLIVGMERHAQGVDKYLSNLGDPCSSLWGGYLTIEEYKREGEKAIRVIKVGVSQVHRETVKIERRESSTDEQEHYANSPLVQPTQLKWGKEVRTLDRPIRLKNSRGEALYRNLRHIHREAFDCDDSMGSWRRERLAKQVPDVPGKRSGTDAGRMPEIRYENQALTLEDLISRGTCKEEDRCRRHWETVHMRREAASALLTGLYAIRKEMNRTLEWLAEETVGAQCTYLRDEPRVCVFGAEGGIQTIKTEVENESNGVRASATVAYQQARDFSLILNEEQVAALQNERNQAAMARSDAIDRMYADFHKQFAEVRYGQEINDRRLQEVANEAARMAWIQFTVRVVQDQVTELVETATEQMVAHASNEDGSGNDTPPGWTMIVLEPQDGETGGGESASQIGGVAQHSNLGSPGGLAKPKAGKTVLMAMIPKQKAGQANTNNYAESIYGQHSGLGNMQRMALWLPKIPPDMTNVLAGIGDGMTLGITKHVRNWVGVSAEVDIESGMYRNGTLIGLLGPGAVGVKGTLKIGKQLIKTGKFQKKFGNYSVVMKAGHGQRSQGISLISHGSKGRSGRVWAFDVPTKLKGPGSIASKLPHMHIGRYRAHLPWEPPWLIPAAIATYTSEAE